MLDVFSKLRVNNIDWVTLRLFSEMKAIISNVNQNKIQNELTYQMLTVTFDTSHHVHSKGLSCYFEFIFKSRVPLKSTSCFICAYRRLQSWQGKLTLRVVQNSIIVCYDSYCQIYSIWVFCVKIQGQVNIIEKIFYYFRCNLCQPMQLFSAWFSSGIAYNEYLSQTPSLRSLVLWCFREKIEFFPPRLTS